MTAPDQAIDQPIRLQCCAGQPAPAEVVAGWRHLQGLPEQARRRLWTLLGPALSEPPAETLRALLEAYSREDQLDPDQVLGAVRACEFLLTRASSLDLAASAFGQDLAALSGEDRKTPGILLARCDAVKAELRARIFRISLAEHGKVLTSVDWRIDTVAGSSRGANLNTSVVLLTLGYEDAGRSERITLQLTGEGIAELKAFCDRFGVQRQ